MHLQLFDFRRGRTGSMVNLQPESAIDSRTDTDIGWSIPLSSYHRLADSKLVNRNVSGPRGIKVETVMRVGVGLDVEVMGRVGVMAVTTVGVGVEVIGAPSRRAVDPARCRGSWPSAIAA